MSEAGLVKPEAILGELEKLAKHGFDYFLAGAGVALLLSCLFLSPGQIISSNELLLGAASGVLCIAGAIVVGIQKRYLAARTNYEILSFNRFAEEQNTVRLKISGEASNKIQLMEIPK